MTDAAFITRWRMRVSIAPASQGHSSFRSELASRISLPRHLAGERRLRLHVARSTAVGLKRKACLLLQSRRVSCRQHSLHTAL